MHTRTLLQLEQLHYHHIRLHSAASSFHAVYSPSFSAILTPSLARLLLAPRHWGDVGIDRLKLLAGLHIPVCLWIHLAPECMWERRRKEGREGYV